MQSSIRFPILGIEMPDNMWEYFHGIAARCERFYVDLGNGAITAAWPGIGRIQNRQRVAHLRKSLIFF